MILSFCARRALLSCAVAAVAVSVHQSSAVAQEPGPTLVDAISIYAEREAKRRLDIPQTVTVIRSEEIERRMVRDVQDLVRYEPGVTVSKTTSSVDPFSSLAGFTIRGVSGNRVQMLVDGTRIIESITDGNRDFVNMSNLKAVEIIRGPAGVMWGADALGGVVAFVTKDPEDYLKGRNFGGQVGTHFDTYDNSFYKSAAVAARMGDFSMMISAGQRSFNEGKLSKARADGGIFGCPRNPQAIRCNELNPVDGSDYDLLGKVVWTPNAEHEVKLTGELVNKHWEVDQRHDLGPERNVSTLAPTGNTILSYLRDQEQTRYRGTLMHRYSPNLGWLDNLRWQLTYSPQERDFTGVRHRRLANTNLERLDYLNNWREEFYEGDLQLNSSFTSLGALHKLTYGGYYNITEGNYRRRDISTNLTTGVVTTTNSDSFASATTTRRDLFLQDEISFFNGRMSVTPGVRYATYELDPDPSPYYRPVPGAEPRKVDSQRLLSQVAATVNWTDRYSTYARFAEGYKMPTAQQLYTSNPGFGIGGGSIIPAPNLKPESVESYEIGLRGKLNDGFFSIALFQADYDNFIQNFVMVPSTTIPGAIDITYRNLAKVNLWGVEFSGEWRVHDKWSVNVTASYVDGTQQLTASSPVTKYDGTTPITIVTGLRYLDNSMGIDAQLFATWADKVGGRSAPNLFRPSSYAVYDFVLQWKPKQIAGLSLNASVLNILDTRYFRSLNGATTYAVPPSPIGVAVANPLELQTAPGRTFKVGANYEF